MKRSMKIMTRKEKQDFILRPLMFLLMCVLLVAVGILVSTTEGPEFAYVMCGAAGFLFIYCITLEWDSLKKWRNGGISREGLDEDSNPEQKKKK